MSFPIDPILTMLIASLTRSALSNPTSSLVPGISPTLSIPPVKTTAQVHSGKTHAGRKSHMS